MSDLVSSGSEQIEQTTNLTLTEQAENIQLDINELFEGVHHRFGKLITLHIADLDVNHDGVIDRQEFEEFPSACLDLSTHHPNCKGRDWGSPLVHWHGPHD